VVDETRLSASISPQNSSNFIIFYRLNTVGIEKVAAYGMVDGKIYRKSQKKVDRNIFG
jgi:hypothetical protein